MSYRIKLDGTTKDAFDIGLNKITLDASGVGAPWTWTFPAGPGSSGYFLQTDGTGNLTWAATGASSDSTVPYYVPLGDVFTVNTNKQALFTLPITIDGTIVLDGILVEV